MTIRYRRLGHLVLNVTDLERSTAFYRDLVGLLPLPCADPGLRLLRCSAQRHDLVLAQGVPGLKRIAFELESAAQIEPLARALDRASVAWVPIPDRDRQTLGLGRGLRTAEPATGAVLDFYADPVPAAAPFDGGVAGLRGLGHVVLDAVRPDAAVSFFTEVLNFAVSDRIDGAITFLRCPPNPLHHSIGVADGRGRDGLHHLAFLNRGIDDFGRGLWRLRHADATLVNGPGRHLPSGSLFLYFLDPDGLTLEYSAGMEEFPERDARPPRLLPFEPRSFDLWEGPVDARKSAVGAIERESR